MTLCAHRVTHLFGTKVLSPTARKRWSTCHSPASHGDFQRPHGCKRLQVGNAGKWKGGAVESDGGRGSLWLAFFPSTFRRVSILGMCLRVAASRTLLWFLSADWALDVSELYSSGRYETMYRRFAFLLQSHLGGVGLCQTFMVRKQHIKRAHQSQLRLHILGRNFKRTLDANSASGMILVLRDAANTGLQISTQKRPKLTSK